MYERKTESGHKVVWQPSNKEAAEKAMKEVSGTGVPDTKTLPDDANVSVDDNLAERVKERYTELTTFSLSVSLDDGDVASGGTDEELVTVELRNDGDLVSGENTAVVEVDGYAYDVPLTDGTGTHSLTTAEPAGSNVEVEAVDVLELGEGDETVESSRTKAVNVV